MKPNPIDIYLCPIDVPPSQQSEQAWRLVHLLLRLRGIRGEVARAPGGKPYLVGRDDVHFNLSHTRGMIGVAISAHHPVGIDVQRSDREVSMALAERVLSPDEMCQYQERGQKPELFFAFWTLKEAVAKYTGEGLAKHLQSLSFSRPLRGLVGCSREDVWAFYRQENDIHTAVAGVPGSVVRYFIIDSDANPILR